MTPAPPISTFAVMKARILKLCKGSIINLQVAKNKAKIKLIATEDDCKAVLRVLEKPRRIAPLVPPEVKQRYQDAYKLWFQRNRPNGWKDGFYTPPVIPKIHLSGGLRTFIINHLEWMDCFGTPVNTTGRKIWSDKKKQEIWITGTTRIGSGDSVACIKSLMIWFEIKIGADTPSDKQLRERARVERSGGKYYFVKTATQYLDLFDRHYYG